MMGERGTTVRSPHPSLQGAHCAAHLPAAAGTQSFVPLGLSAEGVLCKPSLPSTPGHTWNSFISGKTCTWRHVGTEGIFISSLKGPECRPHRGMAATRARSRWPSHQPLPQPRVGLCWWPFAPPPRVQGEGSGASSFSKSTVISLSQFLPWVALPSYSIADRRRGSPHGRRGHRESDGIMRRVLPTFQAPKPMPLRVCQAPGPSTVPLAGGVAISPHATTFSRPRAAAALKPHTGRGALGVGNSPALSRSQLN